MIVTELGRGLKIPVKHIRSMGRSAAGVQSIRLNKDDVVCSMEIVEPGASLLVVTKGGVGKQTPLEDYNLQGRGGQGAATIDRKAIAVIGKVAAARVVQKGDDLTIISSNGIILRLNVNIIKEASRATKGVKLINLGENDYVVSMARIKAADLEQVVGEEGPVMPLDDILPDANILETDPDFLDSEEDIDTGENEPTEDTEDTSED
jgi:DNA gyrase subunit A